MRFSSNLYKYEADAELDLLQLYPPYGLYSNFIDEEELFSQLKHNSNNLLIMALSKNLHNVNIEKLDQKEKILKELLKNYHIKNLYDIFLNFHNIWLKNVLYSHNQNNLIDEFFNFLLNNINCFNIEDNLVKQNLKNKKKLLNKINNFSLNKILNTKKYLTYNKLPPFYPEVFIIENINNITEKNINSLDFSFSLTDLTGNFINRNDLYSPGIIYYYNVNDKFSYKKKNSEDMMKDLIDYFHYPQVFFNGTAFVGRFSRIILETPIDLSEPVQKSQSICDLINSLPINTSPPSSFTFLSQSPSAHFIAYNKMNFPSSPEAEAYYNLLLLFWLWIPSILLYIYGIYVRCTTRYTIRA